MTENNKDEEKAEEYLDKKYLKDMGIRRPVKEALLYGLAEGRKEGYEQGKNNERELQCGKKNYEKDIARLRKENTELKAQIEKMKCCHTCKYRFKDTCYLWLGEGVECKNKDKWELPE